MPARRLREDRLLHEAEATGGDPRRICDLFGLTVGAALRYTSTVDQAGLVEYNLRNAGSRKPIRHGRDELWAVPEVSSSYMHTMAK
ncbi:hypothetical protein [Streptomyces sp. RPT161]|uniref:hypothetical protein n=1 Tax=Streptomyces sp. RPT161 TaxID=3015993 RepID=UPI0022B8793C|nr:hypothetical protein [Streptomyces sp. RPT161]